MALRSYFIGIFFISFLCTCVSARARFFAFHSFAHWILFNSIVIHSGNFNFSTLFDRLLLRCVVFLWHFCLCVHKMTHLLRVIERNYHFANSTPFTKLNDSAFRCFSLTFFSHISFDSFIFRQPIWLLYEPSSFFFLVSRDCFPHGIRYRKINTDKVFYEWKTLNLTQLMRRQVDEMIKMMTILGRVDCWWSKLIRLTTSDKRPSN